MESDEESALSDRVGTLSTESKKGSRGSPTGRGQAGQAGRRRLGWKERRAGEDELQYTRWRIAEIIRRVNYFIGTVRMSCGKVSERKRRQDRVRRVFGCRMGATSAPSAPPRGRRGKLARHLLPFRWQPRVRFWPFQVIAELSFAQRAIPLQGQQCSDAHPQ